MEFELEDEYIELIKLLKVMDLCPTGGMAKRLIEEGRVFVDGEVELRKRRKIRSGMTVKLNGQAITVL